MKTLSCILTLLTGLLLVTSTRADDGQGFLYGTVTLTDGTTHQGRLRFGEAEEAFWGHYFNSRKTGNAWAELVPQEQLVEKRPVHILGLKLGERSMNLARPLMVRFGDIATIEANGRDLTVTLKNNLVFNLDRFEADDFADGLQLWDGHEQHRFDEWKIRSIEFRPTPVLAEAPDRLHGTVFTAEGAFTGYIQWNREACLATDTLDGHANKSKTSLRFDTIQSIEKRFGESSQVTRNDGSTVVLSGTREAGENNRGIYVDDPRFGRVLVSWGAFQRLDLNPAPHSGPGYGDFPVAQELSGSVTLTDGRRLNGRLVFDLDEHLSVETLDAPSRGIHYTIPFGMIESIQQGGGDAGRDYVGVTLHSGESLNLERRDDLGPGNAGMLVLGRNDESPSYVSWSDIRQVSFDRPSAMFPPIVSR
ncbi:MAG: hypothetical protein QNJ40_13545 [Xanthomonadales bacterium]|nr:hypothetical protein [Xanthomonadales bacterium]